MCTHERTISINAKCNDLCSVQIPHMDVDHDGYMPTMGVLGGDYVDLTICLDCGQVLRWEPITDDDINEALGLTPDESAEEDLEPELPEQPVFSLVDNRLLKIKADLERTFGAEWRANSEVTEILYNTLDIKSDAEDHHLTVKATIRLLAELKGE